VELSHTSNKIKGKQDERNLTQWKISDSETKIRNKFRENPRVEGTETF
jgi:hypothetical protein